MNVPVDEVTKNHSSIAMFAPVVALVALDAAGLSTAVTQWLIVSDVVVREYLLLPYNVPQAWFTAHLLPVVVAAAVYIIQAL